MIYIVRMPGDDDSCLDWFEVFGTKKQAMDCANNLSQITEEGWKVKYLKGSTGNAYWKFQNQNTIIVEQCLSYYHGA